MAVILLKITGFGLNLLSLFAPKLAAKLAGQLFCTPPKPRVRPKDRHFLNTARMVHRELAGQALVEYHWGPDQAPLILLSYGWGYNAGRWRHFVPKLVEAGYHVLAFDPPGHGLAPSGLLNIPLNAAIIRALLEDYGPAEALIGHSFGGSSNVYALKDLPLNLHPDRMVIMASFSFAPRVFRQFQAFLGLWSSLYWGMVRAFEKMVGHSMDYYDFALMSAGLSHIKGMVVHDPEDAVTPFAESRRYHDFWPGSYLLSARNGGGHHLGTAKVTGTVLQFLLDGEVPAEAKRQDRPLPAGHELVQHFVGL